MESGAYSATSNPAAAAASIATPPHLSELKRRLYVYGVEDIFNGDLLGLMLLDQFHESLVNPVQAKWQRLARGKLDGTTREANQFAGRCQFHQAVSGIFGAAIDAENPHVRSVYPSAAC